VPPALDIKHDPTNWARIRGTEEHRRATDGCFNIDDSIDWCIWPGLYAGTEFEMGGSYNDRRWVEALCPGRGPTGGLQFPWDDLHFRTNVYYYG